VSRVWQLDLAAMTAIWFALAAVALVGAIVLLYFDRLQRQRTGHVRQVWAKAQGYTYVSVEPALAATWRRGAMAKLGYLSAVDVVSGNRKGEKFVLFDLEDAATLVAVRRQIGSDIDIDLRLKTAAPPKDADLELLGAIGDRVVFATNPDIARHAVDQRMVAFIETLPSSVQQLWSEGNWTLGVLPVGMSSRDWETAVDAVLRLSGLLHVLPPVAGGTERGVRPAESESHDPGRPRPRPRDDDHDDLPAGHGYDAPTRDDRGYEDERERPYPPSRFAEFDTEPPVPHPDDDEDDYAPLVKDIAGESEPPRRPALAVVPDPRSRVRRNWPPAQESWPEEQESWSEEQEQDSHREAEPEQEWHEEEPADQPGGPFHPGFRPYQGPASR
jgi:hypothetical protein